MGAQLSLKAALPLAERIVTASNRCSKTGPKCSVQEWCQWLSARPRYLHCSYTADTAVLHQTIVIECTYLYVLLFTPLWVTWHKLKFFAKILFLQFLSLLQVSDFSKLSAVFSVILIYQLQTWYTHFVGGMTVHDSFKLDHLDLGLLC